MASVTFNKVISINTEDNTYKYYDKKLKKIVRKKFKIGDHIKYDYLKSGFEEWLDEKKTNKFLKKTIINLVPNCKLPNHHSVYVGDGMLIEYIKLLNFDETVKSSIDFIKSSKNLKIAKDSLYNFVKKEHKLITNGDLYVGTYKNINKKKILYRSDELLKNKNKYKFLYNNCENIAVYCITGRRIMFENEFTNAVSNIFNFSLKTIESISYLRRKKQQNIMYSKDS